MNTSRRGFLAGLAALVAAPAIVRVSSIMPVKAVPPLSKWYTLWGDGVHDDTAGVDAMLRGESVFHRGLGVLIGMEHDGGHIYFPPGIYRKRGPLDIEPNRYVTGARERVYIDGQGSEFQLSDTDCAMRRLEQSPLAPSVTVQNFDIVAVPTPPDAKARHMRLFERRERT
jgi:hypothetical protein